MAKIRVNLHIDTKDAEARVNELAVSLRQSRRECVTRIETLVSVSEAFEGRLARIAADFRLAAAEEIASNRATLDQIDALFAEWSK